MAFMTAYMDESNAGQFFIFAGFVSTVSSWNRFSREWEKVLREYNAPYLHMKEFAFFRGPFQGWSESQRKSLLQRLLFLIKSPREPIHSFSCSFNHQEFDSIFPPKFRAQQNHYYFAVNNCIAGIHQHCKRKNIVFSGSEKIAMVFDEHAQFAGRAVELFRAFKSNENIPQSERDLVGSLSFGDDGCTPPLQAADLLAYEIGKKYNGFDRIPGSVLNQLEGSHAVWKKKDLHKYADAMKAELPQLFD